MTETSPQSHPNHPGELSEEERQKVIPLAIEAWDEFDREGAVYTVHCDVCGSLVRVEKITPTAWEMGCDCGRFRDTVRAV